MLSCYPARPFQEGAQGAMANSIYDQPVRQIIPEMADALAPQLGQIFSRDEAIAWFAQHYPKIKRGTISAHLTRFSTNAPSRLHFGARPDEDLLYQVDPSHFRRYDPSRDPAPIHTVAPSTDEPEGSEELGAVEQSHGAFAYESDLRDFLAKNMTVIEPGLRLYSEEGVTGVEFPVGGRFVDLLAVDKENRLVVIELKVSKGYDRVVGQLLRYVSWIKRHQAEEGQAVRGIIVAREISEDLRLACSEVPAVTLFEYTLAVSLRQVQLSAPVPEVPAAGA